MITFPEWLTAELGGKWYVSNYPSRVRDADGENRLTQAGYRAYEIKYAKKFPSSRVARDLVQMRLGLAWSTLPVKEQRDLVARFVKG